MALERLQKVLAASGVASRRASEALIAAGRVTVDGRVATLGLHVDSGARIEVDGVPIGVGSARSYVAVHKPIGVTSTVRDPHAEATVLDLIPTAFVPDGTRLFPVGRLDRDSEGLLILTNDGEWAERVLHPKYGVEREYAVGLPVALSEEQAAALQAGIAMEEGTASFAAPLRAATPIETRRLVGLLAPPVAGELTWYRAILVTGWKRQVRRMFAAVGAPVSRLVRVRIGPLRIDELPSGRARLLKAPEVRGLGTARPQGPHPLAATTASGRGTQGREPAGRGGSQPPGGRPGTRTPRRKGAYPPGR